MTLTHMRIALLFVGLFAGIGFGQTKYREVMLPVRDGQSIAADLYIRDSTVKKPTILVQTPYNKNFFRIAVYLPQGGGIGFPYDSLQYNYVIADWRGFFASKDAAKPGYDRGLDGYDLVEWIAAQAWSDGKVGTWGGSALGLIQFQTAKHQPPHLVCAMPFIINYKTEYENYFPGGVFLREHYEQVQSLGLLSTDLILQHPTYDNYWKIAENLTDYPDKINIPLLILTGWYDHFPDAVIRGYESLRERSAASVKDKHKLVIGPWLHTKVGAAEQGILSYPEAAGVPTDLAFQFFGFYLLGQETAWEGRPGVQYFDLGSHTWHTVDRWSDVSATANDLLLFPWDDGVLREVPPGIRPSISFDYDPRNPSPSIGASTFNDTLLHGPQDISKSIEERSDVLVFTTDVLTKDIIVRGPIVAEFSITTDRLDSDFGIRLCDVYPNGRSVIIADAMQRLRFRKSTEAPTLVEPTVRDSVSIRLRNLAITFAKGHRLRIVVSSSNFPRFDLNLNNGQALYEPGDTLVAHNSIVLHSHTPSYISIPVETELTVHREAQKYQTMAIPNPCNEITYVHMDATAGNATLKICDALGRTISSQNIRLASGPNSIPVVLEGLAAGVYYVQISGHKTGVVRVIKSSGP